MNRVNLASTLVLLSLVVFQGACAQKSTKANLGYAGLGQESVSPEVISQFAPPALDPELSRKIQSYLDIRSPGLGLLSPDKKKLFFSWRVTGTTQVWRLDQPKSFPVQMTGGEDHTFINDITPNGKWLILSRDRNGEENPGLYLQSSEGGPLLVIQHKPKVQTKFGFVSDDSRYVYYLANDKDPQSFTIYRYDIDTGKAELIFDQPGYWYISDYKKNGTLLLGKAVTNIYSEVYEYEPETKKLNAVFGPEEKNDYSVEYGAKEGEFIVSTSRFGEFKKLYSYQNKKWKEISSNIKWDVSGFSLDRQRKNIIYSLNEGGYSRIRGIDANTYRKIKIPEYPEADHVYAGTFSKDGSMIMLGIETSKGPRTSYSYNLKTGHLTQWVLPSQPEVNTKNFATAKLEYYTAKDGTKIPMFVRRPEVCTAPGRTVPCPVVVHFHGGPEGQSTAGFSVFSQLFIDEGMIYVEPNVRGSTGYGKNWLDSDNGALRLKVISDIEDAASFIKKNWQVQGKAPKVGVFGWSYGGYSTLYAMTKFAGSYDAGVALVGMSNLITFLENTAPYRRALRTPEYGDPKKDRQALVELSPSSYLENIKDPLLLIQGVNDPRVPVGEALQMHKMLGAKGIDSRLILFADEGHGSSKRSNQVLEIGHTINFMKTHLF